MEFAQIITELFNDNGIRPIELAKKTGLSTGLISNWCNGKKKPSYDNLVILKQFFRVSGDYLLTGNKCKQIKEIDIMSEVNNADINGALFAALSFCDMLKALRKELPLDKAHPIESFINLMKKYNVNINAEAYQDIENMTSNEIVRKYYKVAENVLLFYKKYYLDVSNCLMNEYKLERYLTRDFLCTSPNYPHQFDNNNAFIRNDFDDIKLFIDDIEIYNTDISCRIKSSMRKLSYTPESLASDMGVDTISVISWINGERLPNAYCLTLLNGLLEFPDIVAKYEPKYVVLDKTGIGG